MLPPREASGGDSIDAVLNGGEEKAGAHSVKVNMTPAQLPRTRLGDRMGATRTSGCEPLRGPRLNGQHHTRKRELSTLDRV